MKKITSFLILALIAVFAFSPVADAKQQRYSAQVYKVDMGQPISTQIIGANQRLTGITYKVFAVGTTTAETLYASTGPTGQGTTAKTNPVSATVYATNGGRIDFVCDPTDGTSDRYVDLLVVDTVGGYSAWVKNFDPGTRTVIIDETRGVNHVGTIWMSPTTTDETLTGVVFDQNTFIEDVSVEVVTAVASTVDIGLYSSATTAGNPNGFRKGVLMTTTGWVADTAVVSTGVSVAWVSASTYGALLYSAITGTGTAVTAGGGKTFKGHTVEKTLTGQLTYTSYVSTARGLIYYEFIPRR